MFHGASSWSRNTSRFLFVLLPFMPMPCSISLPVLPHVSPTRLNSRLDGVGGGGGCASAPHCFGRGGGRESGRGPLARPQRRPTRAPAQPPAPGGESPLANWLEILSGAALAARPRQRHLSATPPPPLQRDGRAASRPRGAVNGRREEARAAALPAPTGR